jgi:hypothetical protein
LLYPVVFWQDGENRVSFFLTHPVERKFVLFLKNKLCYFIFFLHFGHTEIHSWALGLSPWSELSDKFVGLV